MITQGRVHKSALQRTKLKKGGYCDGCFTGNVEMLLKSRIHWDALSLSFFFFILLRKDRNGMDLTEAEDIKKRWQEYTEKLYKKIFMTQITTMV